MSANREITKKELLACQFSSWYTTFRNVPLPSEESSSADRENLQEDITVSTTTINATEYNQYHKNVTIRSIIIKPLSEDFVDYLKGDGVTLPQGAEQVSSFLPSNTNTNIDDDDWSHESKNDNTNKVPNADDNDSPSSDTSNSQDDENPPSFPELTQQIQEAITTLNGSVLPKLNWSSPKDAAWLNNSSMKCCTAGDVYLLVKSSDFCMHDLMHAMDDIHPDPNETEHDIQHETNIEYELVLRKWSNLHASMEFRCFVKDFRLVAISQRHHIQYYPHLKNDHLSIRQHIIDFYKQVIHQNYANGDIANYVFDVYIDKNDRVWLVDFNLYHTRTDALLFEWEEIEALSSSDTLLPTIKIVENENEVHYDPLASYRAPIDTVDLASDQFGSQSFQEFMKLCQNP